MDPSRRAPRAVIDLVSKFRQVGFFTPPELYQLGSLNPTHFSPSANSLSHVMIHPPLHLSDTLLRPIVSLLYTCATGGGGTSFDARDVFPQSLSPASSSASYSSRIVGCGGGDEGGLFNGKGNGVGGKALASSSFPRGGFDLTAMKAASVVAPASELTTVSAVNDSLGIAGEVFVNG